MPYADQYDVWSADRVKLHLKVSRPGELWGFLKFWGRELFHYPIEYIGRVPLPVQGLLVFGRHALHQPHGRDLPVVLRYLGVEQQSLLPGLRDAMLSLFDRNTYRAYPVLSMLIQPALYTWLSLLALACAIRRRDRGVARPRCACSCTCLRYAWGPLVGNRYSFCMMTGAPLLIGLMCTPRAHNLPETGNLFAGGD